jgi:hypothetical protein
MASRSGQGRASRSFKKARSGVADGAVVVEVGNAANCFEAGATALHEVRMSSASVSSPSPSTMTSAPRASAPPRS